MGRRKKKTLNTLFTPSGCGCSWHCPYCHGRGDWLRDGAANIWTPGQLHYFTGSESFRFHCWMLCCLISPSLWEKFMFSQKWSQHWLLFCIWFFSLTSLLLLILKEFLSVTCIQGCNSLSRQFIYLETHFCSCKFLIYAVMNFLFFSLHFISCVTVSPPWGERCPWPLRSFLCLTRVWTSWTPSASFPMMLTPRSPTTPSLPWAWWAVVSLGTIWNHEN